MIKIEGVPDRFKDRTFATFDPTDQAADLRKARQAVDEGKSLFLTGITGSGKSHLATALFYRRVAILEGTGCPWPERAVFLPAVEFFVQLKKSFTDTERTESDVLDDYEKANILVIDDLGAEKVSDWSRQMLYTLIDRYYRNERQLIITSNLTLDQVAAQMDDRIASRLTEMGEIMTMLPIDHRVKK
jgi:DNA replication protein DnaC